MSRVLARAHGIGLKDAWSEALAVCGLLNAYLLNINVDV